MSKFDSPLNNLKIASPCPNSWDGMEGDERKRFCGECRLNVYNLSGMTHYDAENLLRNSEGRMCVRFYQRADGTILTQDCPVGWARVKQRIPLAATAVFSVVMGIFSGMLILSPFSKPIPIMGDVAVPFKTPTPMMGAVAVPSPTPKQKATPKPAEILGRVALPKPDSRPFKTAADVKLSRGSFARIELQRISTL